MSRDGNRQVVKQTTESKDPLQEQALAIIKGEQEPPNEMIAYVVKRAKEAREQAESFHKRLAELQDQVQMLKTRVIELRGSAFSYADDVKALLQEQPRVVQPPQKRIIAP